MRSIKPYVLKEARDPGELVSRQLPGGEFVELVSNSKRYRLGGNEADLGQHHFDLSLDTKSGMWMAMDGMDRGEGKTPKAAFAKLFQNIKKQADATFQKMVER